MLLLRRWRVVASSRRRRIIFFGSKVLSNAGFAGASAGSAGIIIPGLNVCEWFPHQKNIKNPRFLFLLA